VTQNGYDFTAEHFLGQSPLVRELLESIQHIAPLSATALIVGERGTGKEMLARLIHRQSSRDADRFVTVNCAAIAEGAMESELFGHVRHNVKDFPVEKAGSFSAASGGTLFLEEISSVPLGLQCKLLHALETKQIVPVGADRPIRVDTRILAASNHDLVRDLDLGNFRHDLYYKLTLVQLQIPPLRHRRDDIPLLVQHFIKVHNNDLKKRVRGITPEALALMLEYEWKGNVRELDNIIERAIILCDEDRIGLQHLPQSLVRACPEAEATDLKAAVHNYERQHIQRILEEVNYDKHLAADRLGVSLSSLYRKLIELSIERREV